MQCCGLDDYDVQHIPMNLIRDEVCYYCIKGDIYSCIFSLFFVTMVFVLVLCVCSTVLCALVCSIALSHHFMVARPVHCILLNVHATLLTFVPLYIAFYTKLQVNNFLQGVNGWQPTNNEANSKTSEDIV